jgi:hypothetical protein
LAQPEGTFAAGKYIQNIGNLDRKSLVVFMNLGTNWKKLRQKSGNAGNQQSF